MKKVLIFLGLGLFLFIGSVQAASLVDKLKGRILLQVESHGEAWYVSPKDGLRHFLGRPDDVMAVLREQGLGISNADLNTIQMDKSSRQRLENIKAESASDIGLEKAKSLALDFINNNLVAEGQPVTIKEISMEYGLYKVVVLLAIGQENVSYLSKDGKIFFPSSLDIEKFKSETKAASEESLPPVNITKSAKPKVELFVMSHCPYGTQMEKGLLPVLDTLGDKIDFELKFCDYAMHGQKELDEQLYQYCIQKNNADKLNQYLACFLKAGDRDACISEVGLDKNSLDSCVKATDLEYNVSTGYADRNTWKTANYPSFTVFQAENSRYGISGSPTLVINGQKVQGDRDSASLLETICSAFETAPSACSTKLSEITPAPGFGFGESAVNSAASCGN